MWNYFPPWPRQNSRCVNDALWSLFTWKFGKWAQKERDDAYTCLFGLWTQIAPSECQTVNELRRALVNIQSTHLITVISNSPKTLNKQQSLQTVISYAWNTLALFLHGLGFSSCLYIVPSMKNVKSWRNKEKHIGHPLIFLPWFILQGTIK